MTELPRVTSSENQPDNQSDPIENESCEENLPVDTSQLCQELRRDLETMKDAHRLIVEDIKSIQKEFKELVRRAQEQNAIHSDDVKEPVFEYSTDYSTETDDSVPCTDGDIDETVRRNRDCNKMTPLRKTDLSSHPTGDSKLEHLLHFSKTVDEKRKNMVFQKGKHYLSTERRGSSMIIELDKNRRLNASLQLDEERRHQQKIPISMPRRNSAMPHVRYFKSPRETMRDDNVFDSQMVTSYGAQQHYLTQDRQPSSGLNVPERKRVEMPYGDSRRTASNRPASLRRLETKRGSLGVEIGYGSSQEQRSYNGYRRASEMLPYHVSSLFSPAKGRRKEPELGDSTIKRRTSVLLEEDESTFQGKRETNL